MFGPWIWLVEKFGGAFARFIVMGAILLAAGFCFWRGAIAIIDWDDARIEAARVAEADKWRAEIEAANTKVAQREAESARQAAQSSAVIAALRDAHSQRLKEIEDASAALPDRANGMSLERRRLLFGPAP